LVEGRKAFGCGGWGPDFLGAEGKMSRKVRHPELPAIRVDSVDDLAEISSWLGTYKERLRLARDKNELGLSEDVRRWSQRLDQRRAELA
jgi:hypothetical protein